MKKRKFLNDFYNCFITGRSGFFLIYTAVFALVCLLVYLPFGQNGMSFIWLGINTAKDGYTQHYTALAYLGEWCREIVSTLFTQGQLEISLWDFSMGYGSDIATSLHYYSFGDPLNFISIFVPREHTETLYNALVILRLYIAGFGFSLFCLKMDKGRAATLAGAIAYVFSGYTFVNAVRHPFFMNPMVYLPFVILGAEKILRKEKPFLFIFMIFISTVSNFYFMYMIVIAVVLYFAIRYFTMERERSLKDFGINVGKFSLGGLLGIAMGSALFLPVVNVLMNSARAQEQAGELTAFYTPNAYKVMLLSAFTSAEETGWTYLAFSAPVFIAVLIMFMTRQKHKALKIGFCVLSVMLLIPIFGKIMNGFSYVSNRWSFIFTSLVAYILTSVWQDLMTASRKKLIAVGMTVGIYGAFLLYMKTELDNCAIVVFIMLVTVALLFVKDFKAFAKLPKSLASAALALLVAFGCCVNGYYKNSPKERNYVAEFVRDGEALKGIEKSSDTAAAMATKGDELARVEHDKATHLNASCLTGAGSTQFYWSLEMGYASKFLGENAHNNYIAQKYDGLNSRTYLDAVASVQYFLKKGLGLVPYGFEKYKDITLENFHYKIYKNKYALPVGYTYSSYIDREYYDSLSAFEKQQAMLQGVVVEDSGSLKNYSEAQPVFSQRTLEPTLTPGENVVIQPDGSILSNKKESTVTLSFEGMENCETYFYVEGFSAEAYTRYQLYNDDCQEYYSKEEYNSLSDEKKKEIEKNKVKNLSTKENGKHMVMLNHGKKQANFIYLHPAYRYSTGQEDFLVNLGYNKESINEITVTLPKAGVYHFDNMQIICQPMKDYVQQVQVLGEDVLENVVTDTNTLSGEITLEQDKILYLSIPYSTGWTATVDGVETDILQANTMFMAIPLEKGSHKIMLTYTTPLMTAGTVVSAVAFAIFIGMTVLYAVKAKKRRNN